MSYAVLQVADFALQAVVRTEAGIVGKPAALLDDRLKKATVVQTNVPARAAGVSVGLTATQAMARCADIVLRPRSAAAEQEADAALLAVARSLSPRVERTTEGVCTIDLTGKPAATHLPHCRTAVEQLRLLGLDAAAGIGRTPLLALYAARVAGMIPFDAAQDRQGNDASGVAASASERIWDETSARWRSQLLPGQRLLPSGARPARQTIPGNATGVPRLQEISGPACPVLAVQDELGFLAPLPLALVDPSAELAAILEGWGIRTLGALTALPKPEVGRRLGQAGIELWERAAGETDRPIEPCAATETFEAAMDLESEIETLEPLLFILRRFVDRLALQLVNANRVAAELALELHQVDETDYRRGFRLPEPTGDPDILFRALHTHLETLHTDSAIKGVGLAITPTRPLVRQQGLFDTGLRDPHGFAETLARVEAVVGAGRIGTPRLETTHRPDAFVLEKPVDVVGPLPAPPILPPLGLPLRRFRPPAEARVPTDHRGPTSVHCAIVNGEVRRRHGPWRRSGEWWKPEHWATEEWDVELERGGLFRLTRRAGQWWVEGMYD